MYAALIAYAFAVGFTGGLLIVVTWWANRRDRAADRSHADRTPEPLPQRIPARVVTPESCDCDDCNALVEHVRPTVAIAVARAEAASIDREWAELNGGAS